MPPDQVITPRSKLWPTTAFTGVAATGITASWMNLTGDLAWQAVCGGGVALTAAATAASVRRDQRRAKVDKIREQLADAMGYRRLTRKKVRTRGWSRSWHSTPKRVIVDYARPVHDVLPDPKWKPAIQSTVGIVFGALYEVTKSDLLKCRIVLHRIDRPELEVDPGLERAAAIVEKLIGDTASVTNTTVGPDGDLVGIEIHKPADPRLAQSGFQRKIERTWTEMMPGRWRARFDLEHDKVALRIRPAFPDTVWSEVPDVDPGQDLLATYDDVAISYADDEDKNPVLWKPAHRPNLMLVGKPGTGKTSVTHTIVGKFCCYGWPVWIVDGKRIEFLGFEDWPNVQILASAIEEQVAVLHRAHELMEQRYNLIMSRVVNPATGEFFTPADFEPVALVIDEWADFLGNLYSWYQERKITGQKEPPVIDLVRSIARKGRSARVHLVLSTQRPDAIFFGKDMRDNFAEIMSLGNLSPQGAYMMWQDTTTGVSLPRNVRGRATGVNAAGQPVEVQTYYMPNPAKVVPGSEEAELLERFRPGEVRHERMVMEPPEPEIDEKTGKPEVVSYKAIAQARWFPAAQRPDLDRLKASATDEALSGLNFTSPMSVFDLGGDSPIGGTGSSSLAGASSSVASEESYDWKSAEYDNETQMCLSDVIAGDLVLVDEVTDQWAFAVDPPEPDLIEDDQWCLSWRSPDDEEGVMQLPEDELVSVRRSVEVKEGAPA